MRHLIVILTFSFFLFAFIGCQTENKPPANEAAPPPEVSQDRPQAVKQTVPEQREQLSAQEKSDRLAELATDVPNVKGATAVVAGPYAVVGIDVDPTLDRSRVGTLKYTVAQALKDDPHGANAIVTADTDLVQRIREVNEDLRQGRPIQGIVEELADIAGRISPQPSREVEREEQPPTQTEQQRQNQTPTPKQPRQDRPSQH